MNNFEGKKPKRMEVISGNIPEELKALRCWVVWKWIFKKGKFTKPPYQVNGDCADSNDPATWTDFETALHAYQNGGKWDGIGFTLSKDDPYVGVDWDDCVDSATGQIDAEILLLVKAINSYTEISPSGTGLKTLVRGKLPAGGHHNKNIGVFDCGRYFCITGRVFT
jgi:putative DNA primase/helicase